MATKIGIIGAGGMARYHIDGFRKAGAEVVAMADVSVDAATVSANDLKRFWLSATASPALFDPLAK